MVTKKIKHSLLAVSIFTICSAVRCNKLVCDVDAVYAFELGITARPDNETIKVGDTIWLEINEPDRLLDYRSNEIVTFSNVENLGSVFAIVEFDDNAQILEALKKFNLNLVWGSLTENRRNPNLFNEYLFENENGYYRFKLGVVPKIKGLFRLGFSNAANVFRKNDKCTKASFTINFKNSNQHYNLNPNYTGGPTPGGGDYYFKVVN